jgi:integrase
MPKAPKGTVSVASQSGMLRLRWRVNGKPYSLPLGLADNPFHRRIAKGRAAQIQSDIALERFDPTLKKYRQGEIPKSEKATPELFSLWIDQLLESGTSQATIDAKYKSLLANIDRFGLTIDNAKAFAQYLRSRQNDATTNQNLSLLKAFGQWCFKLSFWASNPFEVVPKCKGATQVREGDPFNRDEIERILATLKADRYYAHYHDLVRFLFNSGCRPDEAVQLRCHSIDIAAGTVKIYAPKTDSFRILDLQASIVPMLRARMTKPEALLFPAPKGKAINWHNFSQRCWKTICTKAEVPHRVPYFTRHSLASHAIEGGATLPQVAYVLGHKDTRMVSKTYGRMITPPKLPEF